MVGSTFACDIVNMTSIALSAISKEGKCGKNRYLLLTCKAELQIVNDTLQVIFEPGFRLLKIKIQILSQSRYVAIAMHRDKFIFEFFGFRLFLFRNELKSNYRNNEKCGSCDTRASITRSASKPYITWRVFGSYPRCIFCRFGCIQ